jgi:Helix-turn-helix domain
MKPKTQCEHILKDLKAGLRITPVDALAKYGCFRLAARINDLRNGGYGIETEIVTNTNGKNYAQYFLKN